MSEIIFLSNVRLSFPQLVEPRSSVENGVKKYSADFLMPLTHPGVQQFGAEYTKAAQEKWKEHAQAVMQLIQNDRKLRCFGMGSEKVNKKTFQPYDGYAGNVFITAGRDTAPKLPPAKNAKEVLDRMIHRPLPASM